MEDWEDDDFVLPIINSKEQLKRLEERKKMEESNKELIEDLFSIEQIKLPEVNLEPPKPPSKKNKKSNIQKNEMKQKESSKKIKEAKEIKKRHLEIYGDNDYEYDDYEDKFYN
tara:strand:+ start:1307 stop:1645 length:339 start_codon:yes stop_codon:yes gene_type:complete